MVSKSNGHTDKKKEDTKKKKRWFCSRKPFTEEPSAELDSPRRELFQNCSWGACPLLEQQQKLQISLLTHVRQPKHLPPPALSIKL